jgi:DNA-binding response OmpR family regulator
MATILLVEDDPAVREAVAARLRDDGHEVHTEPTGATALAGARRWAPDLLLLADGPPGVEVLELCRAVRRAPEPHLRTVPILLLSACVQEQDRVDGLEAGADDYLIKPFAVRELLARVKALLRRAQRAAEAAGAGGTRPLVAGDLVLDPAGRRLLRRGREVYLPPKEFDLLACLLRYPGQVFTRAQLLDLVWGTGHVGDERTVDVHVRRLREKIERRPGRPDLLETVRGVGYRVRPAEPRGPAGCRRRGAPAPAGAGGELNR